MTDSRLQPGSHRFVSPAFMDCPDPPMVDGSAPRELQFLPVETLIRIFCELDLKAALRLARTSRLMRDIYRRHSVYILADILSREFSPLEGLLRLIDVSPDQLEVPFSPWYNRPIYFAGKLVADDDRFAPVPKVSFKQEHVREIMQVVKAVSRWESAFPRLRFAELTEERRSLRPHEKHRLRCALYNLWRYANSYHQHHPGYDVRQSWARSPEQGEVRAKSLRLLSTTELHELQDLWKTLRAAVATQVCPSQSLLLQNESETLPEAYLELRGWSDGVSNDMIVGGVLRLRPDDLLVLLDLVANFPTVSKEKIRSMIRDRHPTAFCAHESLSHSLARVIWERVHAYPQELSEPAATFIAEHSFPVPFGGILDDEDDGFAMEELRSQLSGSDGWEVAGGDEDEDDAGFSFDEGEDEEEDEDDRYL